MKHLPGLIINNNQCPECLLKHKILRKNVSYRQVTSRSFRSKIIL